MPVLIKLFQRERESVLASLEANSAVTPVLSNQINLMPFSEQLPLTPTSPGDGRLRGILKKTSTSPAPAVHSGNSSESNSGTTVFFPGHPTENSHR